jgi:hypothetical protein
MHNAKLMPDTPPALLAYPLQGVGLGRGECARVKIPCSQGGISLAYYLHYANAMPRANKRGDSKASPSQENPAPRIKRGSSSFKGMLILNTRGELTQGGRVKVTEPPTQPAWT